MGGLSGESRIYRREPDLPEGPEVPGHPESLDPPGYPGYLDYPGHLGPPALVFTESHRAP